LNVFGEDPNHQIRKVVVGGPLRRRTLQVPHAKERGHVKLSATRPARRGVGEAVTTRSGARGRRGAILTAAGVGHRDQSEKQDHVCSIAPKS